MALDTLLETIAREGEAEVRRVIDDAHTHAEQVRATADAEAAARCAAAIAANEREHARTLASRRAAVRAESRDQVLRAIARFLARVFAATERSFPRQFEGESGQRALERLVDQAVAYFPGEKVVVRCRSGLTGALSPIVPSTATIVVDDAVPDGIIVETADGAARIESTLIAALRRQQAALSIELLAAVRGRS